MVSYQGTFPKLATKRSSICEKHGLFYNPAEGPGCVLCCRTLQEEESDRLRTVLLLSLVTLVIVIAFQFSQRSGSSPVPPAAPAVTGEKTRLQTPLSTLPVGGDGIPARSRSNTR